MLKYGKGEGGKGGIQSYTSSLLSTSDNPAPAKEQHNLHIPSCHPSFGSGDGGVAHVRIGGIEGKSRDGTPADNCGREELGRCRSLVWYTRAVDGNVVLAAASEMPKWLAEAW